MTRPVLTLLTAVAMLLQAMTGIAVARAEYVAAPICHTGGGHAPAPGDTSHDCLLCPICAAMAQAAVIVPPIPVVPRSGRIATIALESWSARAVAIARTWTCWPRGPPRVV